MTLNQKSLLAIAIIFSVTLIAIIALTRNTDTEIDIKLGEDKSVNIKGKGANSLPQQTKVDCLPGEENSQLIDCDS